jgi:hypothetical protein
VDIIRVCGRKKAADLAQNKKMSMKKAEKSGKGIDKARDV